MYEELNRTIIVDIETDTHGKAPNPEKDDLKYCGIRLPNGNKLIYSEKQIDAIQRTLNRFKYVVGHNFKDYDKPILERFGVTFYNNINNRHL